MLQFHNSKNYEQKLVQLYYEVTINITNKHALVMNNLLYQYQMHC